MVDSGVVTLQPSGRQLFVSVIDGLTSDAPTLFFLHGLGSSHTFYEAALSQSTSRLISYDFNGHGLSPLQTPLSIDSLANDLKELMDHFGVESARGIVAHSMSGLVATTFASKWPEKVEKLVLLGPMSALPDSTQAVMRQRAATVSSSGLSSIVSKIAESATSSRTKKESPLTLSLIRALVLGTNPQAYAAACEALASAQDPDYTQIRSKMVVIGGSEDYLSDGKMIDAIVGKINAPRSTESSVGLASKVVLEGVGHWIAIEDPKRVAQELNKCFGI
ncbi:BZ3500_MvSof-1268-A1-R1_Chr2-2g05098 [Microbotryum saponariae]|uniref:BZ3500_MvSof-1268-A1-R1_Chr2-2g05098 protein n=1 Tax=Microbotryum saponariae TaxID=289078 RepID=A0A2X0K4M8_9BASI|nr:BZ3500_MvSof-1268-A1-R1_Chr2-2g05098 [Microbotryum saponariae]SDA00906.1 BZ3501_MvSof-1269-A2-R1_Chr2-2g04772 [Microbotryum saponariae]